MLEQALAILHDLPGFLDGFIADHGAWVYALLFAIIFAETGLVIAPFLPGDSLLFTVGALAARGSMNIWLVSFLLLVAAILGDAVNYHIGRFIGPRVFRKEATSEKPTLLEKLLNRKHLDRAHAFFEKYGGKAVVIGRFVPIVRTFVPFVAGAAFMTYPKFAFYNVSGAMLWVGICVGGGWLFGNVPVVKNNFSLVVIGIVLVSVMPAVIEVLRNRRTAASEA